VVSSKRFRRCRRTAHQHVRTAARRRRPSGAAADAALVTSAATACHRAAACSSSAVRSARGSATHTSFVRSRANAAQARPIPARAGLLSPPVPVPYGFRLRSGRQRPAASHAMQSGCYLPAPPKCYGPLPIRRPRHGVDRSMGGRRGGWQQRSGGA
jgi:hypothetical protein